MLKEIIVITSFLLLLSGVIGSLVYVQRMSEKQMEKVEQVIGKANEIN